MAAWWVMPAVIGGLMMYGKSKASAAFRWIMSTEDAVMSMPVALLLTKVSTGEALPAAPQGFRWKPVDVNYAASPFAAPQKLTINVLEQWLNGVPKPQGVSGFLTSQQLLASGMHGFVTAQELEARTMEGFLDKEAALMAPHVGEVLRREEYLYAPQTAPDFGGLGSLGVDLRRRGLVLTPIGPKGVRSGDYVVTTGGALYMALDGGKYKELHPQAGRVVGGLPGRFQSAFGVRRA